MTLYSKIKRRLGNCFDMYYYVCMLSYIIIDRKK